MRGGQHLRCYCPRSHWHKGSLMVLMCVAQVPVVRRFDAKPSAWCRLPQGQHLGAAQLGLANAHRSSTGGRANAMGVPLTAAAQSVVLAAVDCQGSLTGSPCASGRGYRDVFDRVSKQGQVGTRACMCARVHACACACIHVVCLYANMPAEELLMCCTTCCVTTCATGDRGAPGCECHAWLLRG